MTQGPPHAVEAPAVVELALADLPDVGALLDQVWGPLPEPVVGAELLTAMLLEGCYLAGVRLGDELVAASFGFFGWDGDVPVLHSHVTGATTRGREVHAGSRLKWHQRAWCLGRGVPSVRWTYDPLVRRNAHLNLTKLAARPACYLPHFYGAMRDPVNAGHDSDRLLVQWDLTDQAVRAAAAGHQPLPHAPHGRVLLDEDETGAPRLPAAAEVGSEPVLVGTPRDIEGLRRSAPDTAQEWRAVQRDLLAGLMADGWRVTGFADRWAYVLVPPDGTVER